MYKVVEFKSYNIGMKQLLNDFTSSLGSYEKAYATCKQMNVYTEGESSNDPTLEQIVEPIFQEILKQCLSEIGKYKNSISKAFLTGIGTAFTNVDLLFSQFLDIKCSVLKPFFIQDTTDVRYMSEIIEVTEAITLAYEYLNPKYPELQYVARTVKFNKKISNIFNSTKKVKEPKEKKVRETITVTDKSLETLTYITIVAVVILFVYIAFSGIYTFSVNSMLKNMEAKKKNITEKTDEVNSDITYINKNANEYKEVNDEVDDIKNKIESNQIGKFSTYNVASLLQNIIKIIPTNVRLVNISSNDNKYVTIKASSTEYEDLGYFFTQIKLENVLNNAKIVKVENGETTTVEIGGDLP